MERETFFNAHPMNSRPPACLPRPCSKRCTQRRALGMGEHIHIAVCGLYNGHDPDETDLPTLRTTAEASWHLHFVVCDVSYADATENMHMYAFAIRGWVRAGSYWGGLGNISVYVYHK